MNPSEKSGWLDGMIGGYMQTLPVPLPACLQPVWGSSTSPARLHPLLLGAQNVTLLLKEIACTYLRQRCFFIIPLIRSGGGQVGIRGMFSYIGVCGINRCRGVGYLAEGAAAMCLGDSPACVGAWAWEGPRAQSGDRGKKQVALVCAAEAMVRASRAVAPEDQSLTKQHLDHAVKLASAATQCPAGNTTMALCQMARCKWAVGDKEAALDHYREAVGVAGKGAERVGVLLEAVHAEYFFDAFEDANQHISEATGKPISYTCPVVWTPITKCR
eukprot:5858746-Pyramimonas_sp.AAC.4